MEHPQRNRHPGPPLRLLTGLALVLAITACAGFGPDPRLPPPQESLIPTVKVAKAVG